jgi:hypothetical protein
MKSINIILKASEHAFFKAICNFSARWADPGIIHGNRIIEYSSNMTLTNQRSDTDHEPACQSLLDYPCFSAHKVIQKNSPAFSVDWECFGLALRCASRNLPNAIHNHWL